MMTNVSSGSKLNVGIVTFLFGDNFGCSLQRYAMQKALKLYFDSDSALLYYVPNEEIIQAAQKKLLKRSEKRFNAFFSFCNMRTKLFREFDGNFTQITKRFRRDEITGLSGAFDLFLAGSDQVWNPWACINEEGYFWYMLGFAPEEKRISYAASIAVSDVSEEFAGMAVKYLSSFRWLSIREHKGAEILKRRAGLDADVVLDPTMLLEPKDWNAVSADAEKYACRKEPYILCYSLSNLYDVVQMAMKVRQVRKADILVLCQHPCEVLHVKRLCWRCYCRPILNAGPAEFVQLVKNAEAVVTDSFHGSVFAMIFQRPFFTMMRDRKNLIDTMNSRIDTLFKDFQLEDRLFCSDTGAVAEKDLVIDYQRVHKRWEELRNFSLMKLGTALAQFRQ